MSMKIQTFIDPLAAWSGSVEGMILGMESVEVGSAISGSIAKKVKEAFGRHADAVNQGSRNIHHVYEWGDAAGEGSAIRLFRIKTNKTAGGRNKELTYYFVPSQKFVPLPNINNPKYEPSKLSRHVFYDKAFVMETVDSVTIYPNQASELFVPNRNMRGWTFKDSNTIDPGGGVTGNFGSLWNAFMSQEAPAIASAETAVVEQVLRNGSRRFRNRAGRFTANPSTAQSIVTARNSSKQTELMQTKRDIKARMESDYGDE